jgi:hypothetical protein
MALGLDPAKTSGSPDLHGVGELVGGLFSSNAPSDSGLTAAAAALDEFTPTWVVKSSRTPSRPTLCNPPADPARRRRMSV